MKSLRWSHEKNQILKRQRDISFEEVALRIESDRVLDVREHPNQARYPGQRIFVLDLGHYVYLVPFVETAEEIFLKTIIPSRKAKRELEHG